MKTKLFLLILISFHVLILPAQVFSGGSESVGIDEHLGDTLNMELEFINEKNEKVKLKDIIDRPTILSFVYFNCPGLCSPLQQGVAEVIEKIDLELGKDYKSITISFDYLDNSDLAVEKKKNFANKISQDKAAHWYYLTGDSANINGILKATGYKIKTAGLDFLHPSGIIMISEKGVIIRYLYGLTFLPFDLKMAVIEAQKGTPRPTINKVLDLCFNYDPQGKRYSFEVTAIAATMIIVAALVLLVVLLLKSRKK